MLECGNQILNSTFSGGEAGITRKGFFPKYEEIKNEDSPLCQES